MIENLSDQIKRDEGCGPMVNGRHMPYHDTAGHLTIGYGCNLDTGIDEAEADFVLSNRLINNEASVNAALPWISLLSRPRANALYAMAYNMGVKGLLGFHDTLACFKAGNWAAAAAAMRASAWYLQVGKRAERLAVQVETDVMQ